MTFPGATGGEIEAARIGPGTSATVAVLLPQIGGLCGWGRWATAAVDEAGLTSLLVNPCGYGGSTCAAEEDADTLNEVAPAVAFAREELGARRVVLLGTSMGGSLTVIAAANGADVDAWADISGPPAWDGVELAPLAGDLPGHGLVVMAPSDGAAIFDASRALARAAGVRFVAGRSGHGWELLVDPVSGSVTRIGRLLMAHAAGPAGV
jgi:pimeloyl-ACP methyl ester carboxylesterase